MDHWPGVKRSKSDDAGSSKSHKREKKTWEVIGLRPEIFTQILKNVDFERLKTYRCVCKTWNQEICRVLNATAEVTEKDPFLNQDTAVEDGIAHEELLLALLKEGEKLDLPIPFTSLNLTLALGKEKLASISVIRELGERIAITRLAFCSFRPTHDLNLTLYVADLFLICSETLTELEVPYWHPWQELPKIVIQFPRLKKLALKRPSYFSNVSPNTFVAKEVQRFFLETSILPSPSLKEIVLENIPKSPKLLKTMDLGKVEQLTVINPSARLQLVADVWAGLKTSRFTHLKALKLGMRMAHSHECMSAEEFRTLIARFSGTIERLCVSDVKIEQLPLCPKLTHLDCKTLVAAAWDPILLPALKTLKLKYFLKAPPDTRLLPFHSVDEICCYELFAVKRRRLFEKEQKEELLGQLMGLLPNATSWTLKYRFVEGFIHLASTFEHLDVENLTIIMKREVPSEHGGRVLRRTDAERSEHKQTVSALSQLSVLKALTIANRNASPASSRLLIEAIEFKSMPKLRTFRHIGAGLDKYMDLMAEHLSSLDRVVILHSALHACSEEAREDLKLLTRIPNLEINYTEIQNADCNSFDSRYMYRFVLE